MYMATSEAFLAIYASWKDTIRTKLFPILQAQYQPLERNLFPITLTPADNDKYLSKCQNLYAAAIQPGIDQVLEVGFNGGFSALLFLLADPTIVVTIVDQGDQPYVKPCFAYLKDTFGDRVSLFLGNSNCVIPDLETQYDLVHIAGNPALLERDLVHARMAAKDTCIFIMNDVDLPARLAMWKRYVGYYKLTDVPFVVPCPYHAVKQYTRCRHLAYYSGFFGSESHVVARIPALPSRYHDCYYFTNNRALYDRLRNTGWYRVFLPNVPIKNDDFLDAMDGRVLQACPHRFPVLNGYQSTCWMATTVAVNEDRVFAMVQQLLVSALMFMMPQHPTVQRMIMQQYQETIGKPAYAPQSNQYMTYIQGQLQTGKSNAVPTHYTTDVILRKNDPAAHAVSDTWLEHTQMSGGSDPRISLFFAQQQHPNTMKAFTYSNSYMVSK